MPIEISDYSNVAERIATLGGDYPDGLALLPANFESAPAITDFKQTAQAGTVRTLLRKASVPCSEPFKGNRPLNIHNNAFEWVAPIIFVSATVITESPTAISIALNVISNYVTDFLKGISGDKSIKIDIVVERTRTKTCKKISYTGNPEGLDNLHKIVREVADE